MRDAIVAALTAAEEAVATMIVAGDSNEAIARSRGTSPRTVANQVASIFRKCGVGSRAELVARHLDAHASVAAVGFATADDAASLARTSRFTVRERDVVTRAATGSSNKVIANDLGLAPSTVAGHLAKAAAKLGARTRIELIARFRERGRR